MNKGLVSIIIPIYNVAQYLDDCIKSACEQTYKNIEIILVDDGSTDGSAEICDKWAEKDIRIKVIHKKNGGPSDARNAGLEVSKGKYIFFLDGDDSVDLNLLDISISKMIDGVEMVAFGYNLIYSDGSIQKVSFPDKNYILRTDKDKINCLLGPFFRYEIGWNAWNRVFLKSIIDDYKIRFVDNIDIAEDQLFCLCYIAHGSNFVVIDECLYNYYQRDNSIMNSGKRNHILHFGQKNELSKEALAHFKKYSDCNYLIPVFPAIHYMLLERPIVIEEKNYEGNLSDLRNVIYEDVKKKSDVEYFVEQYRGFLRKSKILNNEYNLIKKFEKVSRAKWLIKGHSLWYTLIFKIKKKFR